MKTRGLQLIGVLVSAVMVPMLLAGCSVPNAFKNCTLMNARYPHGVGRVGAVDHVTSGKPVTNFLRSTTIYNLNTGLDRDEDGVACEAH